MTSKRILFTALFICTVLIQMARAQDLAEPKSDPELNRKVQALLSETAQQARELRNRDNQVMTRIALADLMWKDQEASARRLYQEAFDVVQESFGKLTDNTDGESYDSEQMVIMLRDEVLQSLGRHDLVMARQLLAQSQHGTSSENTNTQLDSNAGPRNRAEADRRLESALTLSAADKNPGEAAQLIRKTLEEGSTGEAVSLLAELTEKDPATANSLAADVINKFLKTNLEADPGLTDVAGFLTTQAMLSLAKATVKTEGKDDAQEMPSLSLSPELSHKIIDFVVDAALSKKSGRSQDYLLSGLRSMMAVLEGVAPEAADRLKKKFSETAKENPDYRFEQSVAQNDVTAALEAAKAAPIFIRDTLYGQVATLAWENGNEARATEIVNKYISTAHERNALLGRFRAKAIEASIAKADFARARQLISQTRSAETRLNQLLDLAQAQEKANDNKEALQTLNEAQNLVPAKASNTTELELETKLAHALAKVDMDRSFTLMTSVVDQVNEITMLTARTAGFGHSLISFRDAEFTIGRYSQGTPGLDTILSPNITVFAQLDFDRTKQMFARLERPDVRIAAQLYLAGVILEPPQDCTCRGQYPRKKMR